MPRRALSTMHLHVVQVGLDHQRTPLALRERAAFASDAGASLHVRERAEVARSR